MRIWQLLLLAACSRNFQRLAPPPDGLAPPAGLHYAENPVVYFQSVPITPNAPAVEMGAGLSFTVSPTLPPGLVLDARSGTIAGTPAAVQPATAYVITASNEAGGVTAEVSIEVLPQPPQVVFNDAGYRVVRGRVSNVVPVSIGGRVSSCADADGRLTLLGYSVDSVSCALSGVPVQSGPSTPYALTAAVGSVVREVTVNIEVVEPVAFRSSEMHWVTSDTAGFDVSVQGGLPPYLFARVSGPGDIDARTGHFVPDSRTGDALISVVDATGERITAQIHNTNTWTNGPVFDAEVAGNDLVISGQFSTVNPAYSPGLVRFAQDGRLDPHFYVGDGFVGTASDAEVVGDAIYAVGFMSAYRGVPVGNIVKIDAVTGALDEAFTSVSGFDRDASCITVAQASAYVGGRFNRYESQNASRLVKLHPSGRRDTDFDTGAAASDCETIADLALSGDWLYFACDGTLFSGVRRVHKDTGALDASYAVSVALPRRLLALSDDRLLVGSGAAPRLRILSPLGAVDGSFTASSVTSAVSALLLEDEALFVTTTSAPYLHKLSPFTGAAIAGFTPPSFAGGLLDLTRHAGELYVLGSFDQAFGTGIARIDGTTGAALPPPGTGFKNFVGGSEQLTRVLSASGALVVLGRFTFFGGLARDNVAKMNAATGHAVAAFAPTGVYPGRVAVAGEAVFVAANYGINDKLRAFDLTTGLRIPMAVTFQNNVRALLPVGDKLYVGGDFTFPTNRLVRLDGGQRPIVVDPTFNVGTGFNNGVDVIVEADPRMIALMPPHIYVGGSFTTYNGGACGRACLLSESGVRDANFAPTIAGATGAVTGMMVADDDNDGFPLMLMGTFTGVNGAINTAGLAWVYGQSGAAYTGGGLFGPLQPTPVGGVLGALFDFRYQRYVVYGTLTAVSDFSSTEKVQNVFQYSTFQAPPGIDAAFAERPGCSDSVYVMRDLGGALFMGGRFATCRGRSQPNAMVVTPSDGRPLR